jgi:hypothetical protein
MKGHQKKRAIGKNIERCSSCFTTRDTPKTKFLIRAFVAKKAVGWMLNGFAPLVLLVYKKIDASQGLTP